MIIILSAAKIDALSSHLVVIFSTSTSDKYKYSTNNIECVVLILGEYRK